MLNTLSPGVSWAFADNLKCALPANEHGQTLGQAAVCVVQDYSHAHMMPLSIEKSLILYCGVNNVCHVYMLEGQPMPTINVFKDLGMLRSSHHHYYERITSLSASFRWFAGMIRWVFRSYDVDLLWTAFVTYVKLKVMYATPAWSPILQY